MTFNSFTYFALFFIIFALSRTVLRHRDGSISTKEMFFWLLFWVGAAVVVVWPGQTDRWAQYLGIERGADGIVYVSIILLYYMMFRIYIKLNLMGHDITRLVRALAVEEVPESGVKNQRK